MVMKAADFAARKHAGQTRKGEAREPYVNHLAEVAYLLSSMTQEPDAGLIAVGWLHDTVEDTATTDAELRAEFGDTIADVVREVTDDKSLEKQRRKELQVINTPGKSRSARLLKLADKTSNLRSIVTSPPIHWPRERMLAYVEWSEQVVSSCLSLDERLAAEFRAAAQDVRFGKGA